MTPNDVVASDGTVLKYDEKKLDLSLVEPWLEEVMAEVYAYGVRQKYGRDSWKAFTIEDARKLVAPAKRHLNAYRKGEFFDAESGLPHLAQAAWNLLTIYYHEMKNNDCI